MFQRPSSSIAFQLMLVVAHLLDFRLYDPVDISCADRRENKVRNGEGKQGGATTEVKEVGDTSILPPSPAHLTFAHMVLWILAAPMEEKMKSDGKKEKREGTKAHRGV